MSVRRPKAFSTELKVAVDAATAAGDLALRHFRRGVRAAKKPDRSPVTVADRAAERLLRDRIRRRFPSHAIVGEEYGTGGASKSAARWIIDPIDGTRSFMRGVPFWATLLALQVEGEIKLGVIYAPATGDLVVAERGRGAFHNGRRARVSRIRRVRDSYIIHGSLELFSKTRRTRLLRLIDRAYTNRGFADYLGHLLVIAGKADAMVDPVVKPWDVAPIQVAVEEAGGTFTDMDGRRILGGTAVSTNGVLHAPVVGALR